MQSSDSEAAIEGDKHRPGPSTGGTPGLADVEGIHHSTARALQRRGFLLPVDLRFASADELRAVPGVSRTDVERIKNSLLG